jgi:hypothetical protein
MIIRLAASICPLATGRFVLLSNLVRPIGHGAEPAKRSLQARSASLELTQSGARRELRLLGNSATRIAWVELRIPMMCPVCCVTPTWCRAGVPARPELRGLWRACRSQNPIMHWTSGPLSGSVWRRRGFAASGHATSGRTRCAETTINRRPTSPMPQASHGTLSARRNEIGGSHSLRTPR